MRRLRAIVAKRQPGAIKGTGNEGSDEADGSTGMIEIRRSRFRIA